MVFHGNSPENEPVLVGVFIVVENVGGCVAHYAEIVHAVADHHDLVLVLEVFAQKFDEVDLVLGLAIVDHNALHHDANERKVNR